MKFKIISLICKWKGHDFVTYTIRRSYALSDVLEEAQLCIRCGYDTHENKEDNQ